MALAKLAEASGCAQVFRVNAADELPQNLEGTIGVTAGASAPEELVHAVIERLSPAEGVEEVRITDEDEYFPPPRELRELLSSLETAIHALLAVPTDSRIAPLDREIAASEVLASLTD
jgi:4-hydroxy-3-methylbut-2-enyl diphosphate reductase